MKKFRIEYSETADYSEEIEANTLDEAKDNFLDRLDKGEFKGKYVQEGKFWDDDCEEIKEESK